MNFRVICELYLYQLFVRGETVQCQSVCLLRSSVWNVTDEISKSPLVRISTLILNSVNIKFQLVSVYGVYQ
jgi:hypothetical protein